MKEFFTETHEPLVYKYKLLENFEKKREISR